MAVLYIKIFRKRADEIINLAEKLNDEKVIGWEIKHKFRCKNRGGIYDIFQYRFVANKDLSAIYITEDLRDLDMKRARIYIRDILNGKFGDVEDIMKSLQKDKMNK